MGAMAYVPFIGLVVARHGVGGGSGHRPVVGGLMAATTRGDRYLGRGDNVASISGRGRGGDWYPNLIYEI
jgi:hypothetical protein